jgi:hypothetical protein
MLGKRAAIHAFLRASKASRGWCAFAHHDDAGRFRPADGASHPAAFTAIRRLERDVPGRTGIGLRARNTSASETPVQAALPIAPASHLSPVTGRTRLRSARQLPAHCISAIALRGGNPVRRSRMDTRESGEGFLPGDEACEEVVVPSGDFATQTH